MQLFMSPIMWLLGVVFYFFFSRSSAPRNTDLSVFSLPKDAGNGVTEVQTTNGTTIKGATITTTQASVKANQLVVLFGEFLSSESEILDVFKDLNRADFILIYDKFGKSHQRSLFGNEGLGSNGEDLIEWLTKEVTSDKNFYKLQIQFPDIF